MGRGCGPKGGSRLLVQVWSIRRFKGLVGPFIFFDDSRGEIKLQCNGHPPPFSHTLYHPLR